MPDLHCCAALSLVSVSFSLYGFSCGARALWASAVAVHGQSSGVSRALEHRLRVVAHWLVQSGCSAACEIFQAQGSNPESGRQVLYY